MEFEICIAVSFGVHFCLCRNQNNFLLNAAVHLKEDEMQKLNTSFVFGYHFEKYQHRYGFNDFKNLFGRQPQLIDQQNSFCETDKYLRVKMPEFVGWKRKD